MFKKIISLTVLIGSLMNLAACSPYVEWKEEVKLSDGRVIVVEQKKRNYNGIAAESWLTINLPDISSQPILWHENLNPLAVNVDKGQLYIVGEFLNGNRGYGCGLHGYVNFVWNKGIWNRISFDKIPERIYTTNMLIEDFPPKGTSFLTLAKKNSEEVNGQGTLPGFLKKLSPEYAKNCELN